MYYCTGFSFLGGKYTKQTLNILIIPTTMERKKDPFPYEANFVTNILSEH